MFSLSPAGPFIFYEWKHDITWLFSASTRRKSLQFYIVFNVYGANKNVKILCHFLETETFANKESLNKIIICGRF